MSWKESVGVIVPLLAVACAMYFTAIGEFTDIREPLLVAGIGLAAVAVAGCVFRTVGLLVAAVATSVIAYVSFDPENNIGSTLALSLQIPALAAWVSFIALTIRQFVTGIKNKNQLRLGRKLDELTHRLKAIQRAQQALHSQEGVAFATTQWVRELEELADAGAEALTYLQEDAGKERVVLRFREAMQRLADTIKNHNILAEDVDMSTDSEATLEEVVQRAAELSEDAFKESGVTLEMDLEGSGAPSALDLELLALAIAHILRNAAEASPRGSVVSVAAHSDFRGQRALIEIVDKGSGISGETVKQIFKPFFSTRNGQMGLGLAVAKEIVRRIGGSITVAKNELRGMTFKVRFPMRRAEVKVRATGDEVAEATVSELETLIEEELTAADESPAKPREVLTDKAPTSAGQEKTSKPAKEVIGELPKDSDAISNAEKAARIRKIIEESTA